MSYAICEFVKGLFPGLKKDTVLEDLRVTVDNIDKIVIPMLDKLTTTIKGKFESEDMREVDKVFMRSYKGKFGRQPNMLITLKLAMPNVRQNADFIRDQLESILDTTIIPDGLTSRKAVMIRAAKQVSFISDFTIDFMNVALILETLAHNGELSEEMEVSKGTQIRIQQSIVRFAYAVSDLGTEPKDYEKAYGKTKDIYVGGANAKNVAMSASEPEIDPFDSRMANGVAYNPIFHIGMAIAQWQAKRYQSNKEKKKILELRVLQLKAEMEQKGDPKIVQEINYTQSRIDKLDRDIHDAEQSVGM